ncbi:hypothetical protein ATCC90586_002911 [Pythium insidiosum]|nr:hypothetical protein ATCC90586_002911 [Pythium insidiosum]
MPTLVYGVDISALEGWMIKINNNPSMFGKNVSRRWFRVSYVPAGNDQKLIISYSSNKTSKEPRGWLFIEDVSGVYCRRDMIEVVSPARTLRFKGETAVEHRLWSDSLHKLCNPPKEKTAEQLEEERRAAAQAEAEEERRRERLRQQDRDRIADPKKTKEYVAARRDERHGKREPSPEKHDREDKRHRRRSDEVDDDEDDQHDEDDERDDDSDRGQQENDRNREEAAAERRSSPRRQSLGTTARAEESARSDVSRRHSAGAANRELLVEPSRRRHDSHSDSDSDSDRDEKHSRSQDKRVATLDRRPSQLVASIKSMTPVSMPAEPKAGRPDAERKAPSRTSSQSAMAPRESKAAAADLDLNADDESRQGANKGKTASRASISEPVAQRRESLQKQDEELQSGNRQEEPHEPESKATPRSSVRESPKKPAASAIRADNNFVDDDWDADDSPPVPTKAIAVAQLRHGGVAADANFATDNWDD